MLSSARHRRAVSAEGGDANGFTVELWTLERIALVIER
jgi:hypothetical protein